MCITHTHSLKEHARSAKGKKGDMGNIRGTENKQTTCQRHKDKHQCWRRIKDKYRKRQEEPSKKSASLAILQRKTSMEVGIIGKWGGGWDKGPTFCGLPLVWGKTVLVRYAGVVAVSKRCDMNSRAKIYFSCFKIHSVKVLERKDRNCIILHITKHINIFRNVLWETETLQNKIPKK